MARRTITIATALWLSCTALAARAGVTEDHTFFELKIRPVLMSQCFKCHGGDKVSGELRMDSLASLLRGGEHGPALVPGDPAGSLLMQAVRHEHPDLGMPPRKQLDEQEIADLALWIERGAAWPQDVVFSSERPTFDQLRQKLWSLKPVVKPAVPIVDGATRPIDAFVEVKRREAGVNAMPPADKATLLRRAYFDLIGLPPTPQQLQAFLDDTSEDAFSRVVDQLLDSPHYGERWGRHWLDLARYADTSGDASDTPVPEARYYRDYVIDAFNRDLPYDQFLIEQIAGDILARQEPDHPRWRDRIVASGFIALSRQFGNSAYSDRHLILDNTIDTIGRSVLGMTLACARCHDHKFDPITMQDYYGLYGYFSSTRYPHAGTEHTPGRMNFVPLTNDPQLFEKFLALDKERSDLIQKLRNISRGRGGDDKRTIEQRLDEVVKELDALGVDVAWAVIDFEGNTGDARIHEGGEPGKRGPTVPRGFLSAIDPTKPKIDKNSSGRLELARWIASPDNPLTPRVMVNRIWQYHFGQGLVATSSTFGMQGTPPTHPQLLDWLAATFVESGWSFKAMHRLILNSRAWQLASMPTDQSQALYDANAAVDPGNTYLWQYSRRRLEAEPIRDAMLAVAGSLDLRKPDPHPFPEYDKWQRVRFTQHRPFTDDYATDHRAVYLMNRRLGRNPFLATFDGPNTNESYGRRAVSTVTLQALFWMNSSLVNDAARDFAARVLEAEESDHRRIELAWEMAYTRTPDPQEIEGAMAFLEHTQRTIGEGAAKDEIRARAWAALCQSLIASNEFVYVD